MELGEKIVVILGSVVTGTLMFSLWMDLLVHQLYYTRTAIRKLLGLKKPNEKFKVLDVHGSNSLQSKYREVIVDDGEGIRVPISVPLKLADKLDALTRQNRSDTDIYIIGKLNYKTLTLYSFKEFRFKKGDE